MSPVRTDCRADPRPGGLSPGARAALAAVALFGTAAYAGSFRLDGVDPRLAAAAMAVGWAAGVSWLVFEATLLVLTAARPSVVAWVDVCLRAMGAGMPLLGAAALVNGLAWAVRSSPQPIPVASQWAMHGGLLVASNVLMATVFLRCARPLGLSLATAAAAWVLGLNGAFALFLGAAAVARAPG